MYKRLHKKNVIIYTSLCVLTGPASLPILTLDIEIRCKITETRHWYRLRRKCKQYNYLSITKCFDSPVLFPPFLILNAGIRYRTIKTRHWHHLGRRYGHPLSLPPLPPSLTLNIGIRCKTTETQHWYHLGRRCEQSGRSWSLPSCYSWYYYPMWFSTVFHDLFETRYWPSYEPIGGRICGHSLPSCIPINIKAYMYICVK
jgi:hypothetical protein